MKKAVSILAAVVAVLGLTVAGVAGLEAQQVQAQTDENTIRITMHPGYFQTHDNVFQIAPGEYTFVVENQAGKDAGFVVKPENGEATAIGIKEGETGTVTVEVPAGDHTYYCPIIPTPPYPLTVVE